MNTAEVLALVTLSLVNLGVLAKLYARFIVLERIVMTWADPNSPPPGFCTSGQRHCCNWDPRQITAVHPMPYQGQHGPGGGP
jgi:hypothetical protein